MIAASTRCADMGWRATLAGVLLALALPSLAHKASDAYLQIDDTPGGRSVRWDIALRDLDVALELDADGDGRLTWREVKAAWPRIETYARDRLQIDGCELGPAARALERRNDGAYAALSFDARCRAGGPPVVRYSLLREVDPTHRGIAKIRHADGALELRVLDPNASSLAAAAAVAASPATRAATASGASHEEGGASRGDAPVPAFGGSGAIADETPSTSGHSTAAPDGAALASGLGFAKEGVRHILTGYDHVLFLLCLLLPSVMRRTPVGWRAVERLSDAVWPVVGIVSAFTVAHSITLGLAATKVISLSPAFIEPAIAATIMLAAIDNLWPVFTVRRVVVTFFFGLLHGFGFAGVLSQLELPTARFAWALLQFNLGLELGQILIVVAVIAVLFLARRWRDYSAWFIRGGSFAALSIGAIWLLERTANVALLNF